MAIDRTPREKETRETGARKQQWTPPGSFPMDLNNEPGVRYRWVRTHYNGAEEDKGNLHKRMMAGWRPVKAEERPELSYLKNEAGNIGLAGQVLCKNSEESVQQAVDYYSRMAQGQLDGAASEFEDSGSDPRMPKFHEGNLRTRVIRSR